MHVVWRQLNRTAILLINKLSRCECHRFLQTQIFPTGCVVQAFLHYHLYCFVRELQFIDIQKQIQTYLYKIRGILYKLTTLDTSKFIKNTTALEIT